MNAFIALSPDKVHVQGHWPIQAFIFLLGYVKSEGASGPMAHFLQISVFILFWLVPRPYKFHGVCLFLFLLPAYTDPYRRGLWQTLYFFPIPRCPRGFPLIFAYL